MLPPMTFNELPANLVQRNQHLAIKPANGTANLSLYGVDGMALVYPLITVVEPVTTPDAVTLTLSNTEGGDELIVPSTDLTSLPVGTILTPGSGSGVCDRVTYNSYLGFGCLLGYGLIRLSTSGTCTTGRFDIHMFYIPLGYTGLVKL